MRHLPVSPLLSRGLSIDAAASLVAGAVMAALAAPLHAALGLPQPLLLGAGGFAIGYGVVLALLSRRARVPRWGVWAIIIGNVDWALACAVLALSGLLAPTPAGMAFLLLQAVVVLGFAELQYLGLRQAGAPAPQPA